MQLDNHSPITRWLVTQGMPLEHAAAIATNIEAYRSDIAAHPKAAEMWDLATGVMFASASGT